MKLSIIGAGYVGLVSGVCFAELGHSVSFVEKDTRRLSQLRKGLLPIYEPQLDGLFAKNVKKGRLFFHQSLEKGTVGSLGHFFHFAYASFGGWFFGFIACIIGIDTFGGGIAYGCVSGDCK